MPPARTALAELREQSPEHHGRLVAELLYLANVLMSGARLDGEAMSHVDALTAAIAFTDAGLATTPGARLEDRGPVDWFALGWSRAHAPAGDPGPHLTAARALLARMHRPR